MAKKKTTTKKRTRKTKEVVPINKNAITIPEKLEEVLVSGNLAVLKPEERMQYYKAVCKSVGLNPLTKPFEYIILSGKLTLYARKDCTDQLRKIHGVSVYDYRTEQKENVFIYTAFVQDKIGRKDIGTGVVTIGGLKGDMLANAIMKAETKAKRRGTLSICGLGMLDETELETIADLPEAKHREYEEPRKVGEQPEPVNPESEKILKEYRILYDKIKKSPAFSLKEQKQIKSEVERLKNNPDKLQASYDEWNAAYNERNG